MTFSWQGLVLALLAVGVMGVEFAVTKWIRKVTNTYWFWLTWAILYLLFAILVCWRYYWELYAHFTLPVDRPLTDDECSLISNTFLLNLCPALNFLLPATLIADPSRKATRSLAPFAMIASLIVLFVDITTSKQTELTWRYIFVGRPERFDLYYFGHAMNLFIAYAVILNTPKFGWKGTMWSYLAIGSFYLYVLMMSRLTGCTYLVSGMHLNDFTADGTYKIFAILAPNTSLEARAAIFFTGFMVLVFGEIVLIDISKKGYIAYGDKKSGCWWHWYDYEKIENKEPWGWFSHQWQLKHPKKNIKLKLNKK